VPVCRSDCQTARLPDCQTVRLSECVHVRSESVRARLQHERHWILARRAGTGVFASEELLQRILDQVQRPTPDADGFLQF
jgi:hypothetical protein